MVKLWETNNTYEIYNKFEIYKTFEINNTFEIYDYVKSIRHESWNERKYTEKII